MMQKKQITSSLKITLVLLLAYQLVGCATHNKQDPLEPLNRGTYGFNKVLDKVIVKPIARAYDALLPKFVRVPIGNFFQNLSEIPNVANDLLQGEFSLARHDAARFMINSTWGFGGLLDLASKGGLERHHQDFGLTMACWGYENSAYLVIPFFGPSTIRDMVGRISNYFMSIPAYLDIDARNALYIANLVDTRAGLLKVEPAMKEAVDEYIFIRDAYLQNRQYQTDVEEKHAAQTSSQDTELEGPPE